MSKKEEELCETVQDTSERDIEVSKLRKGFQRLNEDLGKFINDDQRYKLGRVLTIIDASISDPEQRKAIKDLVNNEWWNSNKPYSSECRMMSPHTDIRGLCLALGFELYPAQEYNTIQEVNHEEWSAESYKKTINEQ